MVGCPPPIAECVFTFGKQLQHRRVHPPCHGIFACQWIGFVEYAVCSNTVQSITHPDRNASAERLNADSDLTAVQATNHRLEIEPLHPHRGSILLYPNHRALRRRLTRCLPAWPPAPAAAVGATNVPGYLDTSLKSHCSASSLCFLFHSGSLSFWLRRSSRNANLTRAGATPKSAKDSLRHPARRRSVRSHFNRRQGGVGFNSLSQKLRAVPTSAS
jgi:hypothetical protein